MILNVFLPLWTIFTDSNYLEVNLVASFKVTLLSSVTWQWGYFASLLESFSRDRELKFPFRANRNLTLPITPLRPPGSTLGRALEEIASDVIYFTVLFLSLSFLSLSLLPYLFMMFAVIGSGWSGHVAEILISSLPSFFPSPPNPSNSLNPSTSFSFPVLDLSLYVDAWPACFTGCPSCFVLLHASLFLLFCLLMFFSSTSLILTLCCGFTVFKSTLRYTVAENWRCSGGGGECSAAIASLYSSLHPSRQQRPVFRHLALCRPQALTTHSPTQHTNNFCY